MKYDLHKDARKYLEKLPKNQLGKILQAISKLPDGDVVPYKGHHPQLRLRVGSFRVIFEYRDDVVYVLEVGSRGGIYKK